MTVVSELAVKHVVRPITVKDGHDWKIGLDAIESWSGRLRETDSEFEGEGVAFQPGDVLFGKLRPYLAKVWLADRDGAAVGDFIVLRTSAKMLPRFLQYNLLRPEIIQRLVLASYGSKMPRTSWEELREVCLPVPNPARQRLIIDYLDRETGEIDAFIRDQEELIGLLQERRAATISHAITEGLTSSAATAETNSPWFPRLPAHWGLIPVRLGATLIQTGPFGSQLHSHEYVHGGVPLVNPMHMIDGRLKISESTSVTEAKARELARHALVEGDVLVARRGELGRSAVTPAEAVGALCGTGSAIVRLLPARFDPHFFQLVFSSTQNRNALLQYSIGSTMDNLNADIVGALRIPAPPMEEQREIVARLGRETRELEAAISDARKAVSLSEERRSAMISAAVTGKIDVREHVGV